MIMLLLLKKYNVIINLYLKQYKKRLKKNFDILLILLIVQFSITQLNNMEEISCMIRKI